MRWPAEVLAEDVRTTPALNPAAQAYDRYLEALTNNRKSDSQVVFINMIDDSSSGEDDGRGGGDPAAAGGLTALSEAEETGNWDTTDFVSAGDGVTHALAGKVAPVAYDSPFTSKREHIDFTPTGATPELEFYTNLIKFWLMRDFPFIDFMVHHGKGDVPCLPLYPFAVILMLPACAALRCNVQTTAGYDDFRHWLLSTMA